MRIRRPDWEGIAGWAILTFIRGVMALGVATVLLMVVAGLLGLVAPDDRLDRFVALTMTFLLAYRWVRRNL